MVDVEIRCPACSKRGKIDVAEDVINQSSRGVTAVNIADGQICSHTFIAYIDKNLAVRDCFLTDFQIELPQMETEQVIEDQEIPTQEVVDVDLLKINIPALTLSSVIRAWVFKKPILFLFDGEFLHRHIENLFRFISKNTFELDLLVGELDMYKKAKKHFKKHIVLDIRKIINDKEKILDPKKIKVERTFVQKFYGEYDPKSSLIIFKNQILRAFELTKEIKNLIESYEGEEKLGKKKLIDQLSENRGIKITFSYLEFLLDVIKYYFDYDLSVLSDYYFPAFGI
jgi:hypothetical protein